MHQYDPLAQNNFRDSFATGEFIGTSYDGWAK